ncbi:hypothetical protein GCM10011512_20590 [Tersicoccus solisilvae]|uniref:D-glucuronyl C5-epimerase C-terminal domain-containing protein n=1 Tax=Tersicoccus solisilvae TaxID=1882339 RepID=A0ABQ1P8R7_9MICC|nr:hypothetical protein [Tersicoccus solisilvae]GGC93422.1 hypothetical protein GCM10011512_20590 [Tersicoccus solisilvae]
MSRFPFRFLVPLVCALLLLPAGTATAAPAPVAPGLPAASGGGALTNLAHLDWLMADVPLRPLAGHTTWRLAQQPTATAPWTYADRNADDGTFTRVGGGRLDPATGHYTQGAFNADDISRAAVVYVRDWRQNHRTSSRDRALQLLRALTYLQTSSGPDAGNVVLWQQADGTLTPSAEPHEEPDPSDSAESYWLARTVWALGEGYAAFAASDRPFASFLRDRLHLALGALERQSLSRYGTWNVSDGARVPAWLITGGADATAEAVLGLSAYVQAAPADARVRRDLARYSEGIAAMASGTVGQWPFGAILPSVTTRSLWHAWGGMAPAALARASGVLHRPGLLAPAVADGASFSAQLLAAGGPDNAWSPVPGEAQIAYGVDSRIASLLDTADRGRAPGLAVLAAAFGAWYFGANKAGVPVYDRATGACVDGIETDGRLNRNCGAESVIHTQLSMLALDAHPAVRSLAVSLGGPHGTDGLRVVEAEAGTLDGAAAVVTPDSPWTGEANWSGGRYVRLGAGSSVSIPVGAATGTGGERRVYAVAERRETAAGRLTLRTGTRLLGTVANGGAGAQGVSAAPGILAPWAVPGTLRATDTAVTATATGEGRLDALLLQPLVSTVTLSGPTGTLRLFISAAAGSRTAAVPGTGRAVAVRFDDHGRFAGVGVPTRTRTVPVPAGGMTAVWSPAR